MLRIIKNFLPLLGIILVGTVLRFYQVTGFPVQLNHDEISQLYDAISIAQTGKDIYGNFLPTMFVSVNDYKSPFYTYATSLFYFISGPGELTIKLPGLFFGILLIPAVYFFILILLKDKNTALISALFTAVAPFEIFFSRKSFENGAGIFFMLVGFTFLLLFLKARKSLKLLILGTVFLAGAMYTYFSHAIIIPVLISSFIFIFRKNITGILRKLVLSAIIFLILIAPLFLIVLTNAGASYRSKTVFITQDINLGKNIEISKTTNSFGNFFTRSKAIADFSFNRYLEQFDITYLFAKGLDFTNQSLLGMGPLYHFQLPLLILGIVYLARLKSLKEERAFMLAWVIIGMFPSGLTFESHSPHRSIMVFTMLNIISGIGLFFLMTLVNISSIKMALKLPFYGVGALIIGLNVVYFVHMYFVNFPHEKSQYIQYPFKQVAQFAWSEYDDFGQIIFDPLFGETAPVIGTAAHYYMAYYGNYPPEKMQQQYRLGTGEREVLFDKFSIRKVDWRKDQYLKNVLIIASPWSIPVDSIDKNKIIKQFNFYNGQPAFYAVKL